MKMACHYLDAPETLASHQWDNGIVPLVSICCITYNHEKFIRDTIEGFLEQKTTFRVEIIIYDDASPDDTAEIIRKYADKHSDLFIPIFQEENQFSQGIKPFSNFVFPKARGKYIAICEGDDYWTDPMKLQKQVEFLENNPEYIVCFTNASTVDSDGDVIKEKMLKDNMKLDFSHRDMPIIAPNLTRVMKNEHLDNMPVNNTPGEDTFLLTHQSRFGKVRFLNEVTAHYRVHQGGVYKGGDSLQQFEFFADTKLACLNIAASEAFPSFYKATLRRFLIHKHEDFKSFKIRYDSLVSHFKDHKREFSLLNRSRILLVFLLLRLPAITRISLVKRILLKIISTIKI